MVSRRPFWTTPEDMNIAHLQEKVSGKGKYAKISKRAITLKIIAGTWPPTYHNIITEFRDEFTE